MKNYFKISRNKWHSYYEKNNVALTENELRHIKSLNDLISMKDVQEIYMPLIDYLKKQINVGLYRQKQVMNFLEMPLKKIPFIIGIAGSVAVGKSTTARLLRILLQQKNPDQKVQLITTDGFLYSTSELKKRKLYEKKGFPESYDMEKLISFMDNVKNGKKAVAPVYSHKIYDIIPNRYDIIKDPDILIVEGINVLQLPSNQKIYVSDYFDFSIYIDAREENIKKWYIERFGMLLDLAYNDPSNHYYDLAHENNIEKVYQTAINIWNKINHKNLHDYILPTKNRADLILCKNSDHIIKHLFLKKY